MNHRPGKRSIAQADKSNRERMRNKKRESRAKIARDAKTIPPEMFACEECGHRSPTRVHAKHGAAA